jgi:hypothetical protein
MNALLAVAPVGTWGLMEWVIFLIILAAVIAIAYAALNYFGIQVPPIILRIILIVVVAAFAILAIRFLLSL